MSTPTASVSPALVEALKAEQERTREALSPMLDTLRKANAALRRSAWWKAKAAKAALVALLSELPKWARAFVPWVLALVLKVSREVFPPPLERALVTSQGPHAPPRCSDYRSRTRLSTESRSLREPYLRDTRTHT